MNPNQITLVQSSFEQVVPMADRTAQFFYARLFELDPTLRPLFTSDMEEQKEKLMTMLTVVVRNLHRLDNIMLSVQALGQRHARYGVLPEHYETVGAALLSALENSLGPAFTEDVRKAWTVVYAILAERMQSAQMEAASRERFSLPN